jgi:hypothetical protein
MRRFVLAATLAAVSAVGFSDTANAQVVVNVGGVGAGPIFPGGGLAYTSSYGFGFSPYYGYAYYPTSGYTLGRNYGLPTDTLGFTYGTYYYPGVYYRSGYYGGYREVYPYRGWRRR